MYLDFTNQVEHELKNRGRVCIHGVPGCGKTYFCRNYCLSRDHLTVYIDCKTDRKVLMNLLEMKYKGDFANDFKKYAGLSEFRNDLIYVIFDNIDATPYFSKIYYSLRKADFMLFMTFSVRNENTRVATSDCNTVIKRPFGFFEINDAYNATLTYDTYEQMLSNKEIPKFMHNSIDKIFSDYLEFGGTGFVYNKFENDDVVDEDFEVYFQYQFDYAINRVLKYSDLSVADVNMCKNILKAIALQMLSDDNYKKFNYTNIALGMTYNKCKSCIDFLVNNNILYELECQDSENNKLYYFYDCGILKHYILQLSNEFEIDIDENKINLLLYKNFVMTELALLGVKAKYWKSDKTAVVDFIFEYEDVKYALNVTQFDKGHVTALDMYLKSHEKAHILCLSTENFNHSKKIINSPIYSISCIDVLF